MSKRATDLFLALILIVLTAPIVVVAAVISAVSLKAWPFFTQQRVGLHQRPFGFVKIRTLPTSTPKYMLKDELVLDEVPRACRALRRLHLDELPQLFLVLIGRMSLVGPRPEMTEFHAQFDPEFAAARSSIRPGCTGLWQIGVACEGLLGEAPEYDLYYVDHHELALDIWVLWRTARLMLGSGEYIHLRDMPGHPGVRPLPPARLPRPKKPTPPRSALN